MLPTFRTLLRTLSGKASRSGCPRRPRGRYRPRLEVLEDRAVPASLGYFSTSLNANVYATVVDSAGNMFVTGTAASGFTPTPGAYQTSGVGAIVAKLSHTGTPVYATYLGSGGWGTGIAVDAAGDAYILSEGGTVPTTVNAIASAPNSDHPGDFVAELNATGSGLNYATYLPASLQGEPEGSYSAAGAIALDGSGNIYVAGTAESGFPVTAGAFQTAFLGGGGCEPFFMKLNPALSGAASILYASYFGGSSGVDAATAIAVDSADNAYLEGYTASADFPTTSGAFQTIRGAGMLDVFVAKLNPALSGAASLVYSSYLSGTTSVSGEENWGSGFVPNEPNGLVIGEIAGGIAVDSQGSAYVTSATSSINFPTTPGTYQTTSNLHAASGPQQTESDVFVTKLNATGSALVYSTYLGGDSNPNGSSGNSSGGASIAVDASGDAYVTGWTNSSSFPTKNPVQSTSNGAGYDAFVTELNPSGSGLLFSTYLGNSSSDDYDGYGIALDSAGNVYVGGVVASAGYWNNSPSGGFAAGINLAPSPSFAVTGFPSSTTAGVSHTFTVTALNANGTVNTGYTGTVQFTSSDPQALLPANYTFTAADQGGHTFSVTLKTAGTQSITATDTAIGSITGSESGIVVTPATAAQFVLSAPSSVSSGKAFTVTVTVLDAYGNVATGYTGTIHFKSSDSSASLPANYTFTASDGGVHMFTRKVTLKRRGTQTLTVTDAQDSELTATVSIKVG